MTTEQLFADRYRLERRLGVGGMATVQLAFDTRLERYVAVKLLAEHLAEDSSFVSRFRREALAAARLVHPNIVQVFDFGSDRALGPPVHRHGVRRRPLVRRAAARQAGRCRRATPSRSSCQSCRGLDYAHRNGVVHRDVKPGNLMVNTDGVVKLADFGIAKAAEQSDITKVGSVLGTAAYLSPEQARGEPAGPVSDLYALGVVSYQLMAGQAALRGGLADRPRAPAGGRPAAAPVRRRARRPAGAGRRRRPRAGARPASAATPTRPRWRTRCATGSPASPHTEDLDATRALPDDEATRMLDRHAPRRPRRARRRCSRSTSRRAARRSAARPPAHRRARRAGAGKWVALVLVSLLIAGGVVRLPGDQHAGDKQVQLNEDVGGSVDDAVGDSRSWSTTTPLIEDRP